MSYHDDDFDEPLVKGQQSIFDKDLSRSAAWKEIRAAFRLAAMINAWDLGWRRKKVIARRFETTLPRLFFGGVFGTFLPPLIMVIIGLGLNQVSDMLALGSLFITFPLAMLSMSSCQLWLSGIDRNSAEYQKLLNLSYKGHLEYSSEINRERKQPH